MTMSRSTPFFGALAVMALCTGCPPQVDMAHPQHVRCVYAVMATVQRTYGAPPHPDPTCTPPPAGTGGPQCPIIPACSGPTFPAMWTPMKELTVDVCVPPGTDLVMARTLCDNYGASTTGQARLGEQLVRETNPPPEVLATLPSGTAPCDSVIPPQVLSTPMVTTQIPAITVEMDQCFTNVEPSRSYPRLP